MSVPQEVATELRSNKPPPPVTMILIAECGRLRLPCRAAAWIATRALFGRAVAKFDYLSENYTESRNRPFLCAEAAIWRLG
jgi:hypothetical protein